MPLQLTRSSRPVSAAIFAIWMISAPALAQVHYHKNGSPWKQRARRGPDAVVDGWYYNLGTTGLRAQLIPDAPMHLLVKHAFEGSPAETKVRRGDVIVGAGGKRFSTAHKNGYGEDKFGPDGPILEFANALERAQSKRGGGELKLELRRDGEAVEVTLAVGDRYGAFSKTYPATCSRSDKILKELIPYLALRQKASGAWGNPIHDTFAPLALLATRNQRYLPQVKKAVQHHARTTSATDRSSLINWRYMAAAIVMSEYYLATREKWVLPELEEVYKFLVYSQYTDPSQINPRARETHPDSVPRTKKGKHGGWGHNPGFEGYGPISMITGQGALAFALMRHCGIKIDRKLHDAAYAFLERGAGRNGYLWYADEVGGNGWADMGRTGASGLAHFISPYDDPRYRKMALRQARVIGKHPQSFPDTHGSPIMGMGYTALAAHVDRKSWRRLMDANRWWFVLAQCHDGTFYYQPNRDNAGYGSDARLSASAATAFILSIPKRTLHITGKPFKKQ